jgi:acyl transferase domain-containing protein
MLGSAKGNTGHTEGSAGIAAFIKTRLARHRILPPTVIGDGPNPGLRLDENGLRLGPTLRDCCGRRSAGRGGPFGLGGGNAHAVLESPASRCPTRVDMEY